MSYFFPEQQRLIQYTRSRPPDDPRMVKLAAKGARTPEELAAVEYVRVKFAKTWHNVRAHEDPPAAAVGRCFLKIMYRCLVRVATRAELLHLYIKSILVLYISPVSFQSLSR